MLVGADAVPDSPDSDAPPEDPPDEADVVAALVTVTPRVVLVSGGAVVCAGTSKGLDDRKVGLTVSVPLYRGQPGTVLGGARPPPQSTPWQISRLSVMNQMTVW